MLGLPFRSRPTIEPQVQTADCGYVCMSGLLKILGWRFEVEDVKRIVGLTGRGLSLKQLRDGFRTLGLASEVIRFDKRRPESYPVPGVLLLSRGHYVVIRQRRGASLEIYDPQTGWNWSPLSRMSRSTDGFAVVATVLDATPHTEPSAVQEGSWRVTARALRHYLSLMGFAGVGLAIMGQIVVLGLPLISAFSIDAVTNRNLQTGPALAAVGFVLMSALTAIVAVTSNFVWAQLGRRVSRSFAVSIYDHFALLPPGWYERHRPAQVQTKLAAIEAHSAFAQDALRSVSGTLVGVIVGTVALFYVSPWLMIPGLAALGATVALDLALNRTESELTSAKLESSQRRHAFTLEAIALLPMLARHGALKEGRHKFAVLSARATDHDAKLSALRSWKTLSVTAIRACETLVFVSMAALFMTKGNYSLGLFVAIGAYKDLLAQSIGALFQTRQRHRLLGAQSHFTRGFATSPPISFPRPSLLSRAELEVSNVDFRYGSLDPLILQSVSFRVEDGECMVLRGPSGCGKSTLARLICGLDQPERGQILLGGVEPDVRGEDVASVLQGDRLLTGTIRENVTMFRRGISDEEIYHALEAACCLDFVLSLPMRLNTLVSEGQGGLSGGQRQRLLLARAAIRKAKFVLLDEATSSLDVETETKVLANFKASGATLLLIAHRPEVWRLADRVVELEAGCVIRRIPPEGFDMHNPQGGSSLMPAISSDANSLVQH